MPQLAATGAQGTALTKLVSLLAASTAFQTRRGVASAAEAEEHIYWPWASKDGTPLADLVTARPFLVIEQGQFAWQTQSGGGRNYLLPAGELLLTITDEDRYGDDYRSSATDFCNFADGVIEDLVAAAGESDNLAIVTIEQADPPMQNAKKDWGTLRYWMTRYAIDWDPIG